MCYLVILKKIDFTSLISNEILEKNRLRSHDYVLEFRDRMIPEVSIKHKINIEFSDERKEPFVEYIRKKNGSEKKNKLPIKRVRYKMFPLYGTIERIDQRDGKHNSSSLFTISYDSKEKIYTVHQDNKNDILIPKSKLIETIIETSQPSDEDRFVILLKTLNLPNNKFLTEKGFYTLTNIATYTLGDLEREKSALVNIEVQKVFLRYKYSTDGDDTAVCEVLGNDHHVKYFVDHNTGIIKGMYLITTTKERGQVERVRLFSKSAFRK